MTDHGVLEVRLGDRLRLRRAHPCGGREWIVDRLGADIGITCGTCGRRVLIGRRQLEARIAARNPHGRDGGAPAGPASDHGVGA